MVRKNYKKFVATAATATLVASAIAPVASADVNTAAFTDVPADYKDAVDFLVSNNIAAGKSETQFDIHGNITRGDFAAILARAAGLIDADAPSTGFTDVPDSRALIVNSLKDAGVINGVSDTQFGYAQNIKRGDAAKMITKAFDLDTTEEESKFTDVSAGYEDAVNALVKAGVTNGKSETQFGVHDNIKRGDFAKWVYALKDLVVDQEKPEEGTDGITSVKAINDTRVEVTFGKAIDKDVAREIEKEPARFIGFNGGQTERTAQDDLDFKVTYVTFTDDYKKAELTIDEVPTEDINYTIALMDGENNKVADVVYKAKPTVLKESAEQPTLSVDSKQEKFILDFRTKMKDSAKDLSKFDLVDEHGEKIKDASGAEVTDLSDIADSSVDWVDSTTKTKVEFKLKPGVLEAGKTYKVKVKNGVITDKGDELSDKKDTITVKTPSINESRPEAKIIRLNKDNIQITFDRDLSEDDADKNINERLVKVKTATGKDFDFGNITVSGKTVTIAKGSQDFDVKSSYTVTLPENAFANDMFRNALSKSVNNMKAVAQDNIAVSSMTAAFDRQVDNKEVADLLLKFDQAVKVPTEDFELTLEESGKSQTVTVSAEDIELDTNDTTGKTLRLKDFTETLEDADGEIKEIKNDKTYTVKVASGKIITDSADENKNSKELKATVGGINITAPKIDSVEYVSENKIEVEFKENISSDLKAEDVTVQGYQLLRAGSFEQISLNDANYIKVSVSGKKVTITPVDENIKFVTGEQVKSVDQAVEFKENSVKAKDSDIVAATELTTADLDAEDVTDNAKPVIIGSTVTGENEIKITYSENIEFQANATGADAYNQFSFEGLEYNNYKLSTATVSDNNEVVVTFEDQDSTYGPVFDLSKSSFPGVKVIYRAHADYGLQDLAQYNPNKVANQTLTGAEKDAN